MKKFLTLVLALVMALSLAACGGDKNKDNGGTDADAPANKISNNLVFSTGGDGGTYFAVGGVIAQHVSTNTDVKVTSVASGGSKANILLLDSGDAQLGFSQSDVMAYAYNGTSTFADDGAITSFSTVANLYLEAVQIVTCDASIKTVADLKDKNVSIGDAGSGVYFNAIDILGAYGLTEQDIKPQYKGFSDSADALKDGKIDAAFVVAGAPTVAITDLSTGKDVHLVSIDKEHADALIAKCPYYMTITIPADTYKGLDGDVQTVAVGAVVLAADNVSDDAIYAFVSDIFEHTDELSHAKAKEMSLETAANITSVPYHPGAARYYAEKGITVPTK